ncbi:MAG: peroxiredoxin family protein [Gemmatimonadota bacterium]
MATRLAALAALGATATAGLATTDLHRTGESPVPSEQLMPWRRTAIAASDLPSRGARPIVLYVSAACPHCEGVTRYVDSVARAHRRRLIVVSADADSVMARWMARTGIAAAVARDTALAMRRALDVRFVPTLVTWRADGSALRVVGADRRPVRRAREASR